jgi:hypothetical protein
VIPSGPCIDFASAALRESLSEVTKLVQTELQGLLERRIAIRRRTRSLQQVLRGLQQGVGGDSLYDLSTEVPLAKTPCASERQAGRNVVRPRRPPSNDACVSLRRACRIALLEAGGEASPQQIYSYIARRGSFSFANLEYAGGTIVQMLHIMAKDGETRTLDGAPCSRWQLIAMKGAI